jgi:alkylation response protein AidB-like acyl-CoA dehydrogenase
MSTTTSDRGGQIFAVADRLARTFAERAAEHDREATFPHDNYTDLAAAGILRMSVPEELGGFGGRLPEVVGVLERIASGNGSRRCRPPSTSRRSAGRPHRCCRSVAAVPRARLGKRATR